jgi:hypothetical protein
LLADERIRVLEPPEQSRRALREHGVPDDVIAVACVMTQCIQQAADDMAADTRDEAFDDATSRGGLLYRRAHNRMLAGLKSDRRVALDTSDNALHVRVGGTAISFYSARGGLDFPSLVGSRTKRGVVNEMQLVIAGLDDPVLRRLVLMHESDEDGLGRAALGVLENSRTWAWRFPLFDRYAVEESTAADAGGAAYDELPEPELPPMERRDDDRREDIDDADGTDQA